MLLFKSSHHVPDRLYRALYSPNYMQWPHVEMFVRGGWREAKNGITAAIAHVLVVTFAYGCETARYLGHGARTLDMAAAAEVIDRRVALSAVMLRMPDGTFYVSTQ